MKRVVLLALSAVYDRVTRARNWLYDRQIFAIYRSKLPVVSVGNLTVGGNAKTPLCIFLANEFARRGYKPVILSRGYSGKICGPYQVDKSDSAHMVGDEASLVSRYHDINVVIARDRVAGAKLIEREQLGSIIILDDGLQHRRLYRDVDIISINVGTPESIKSFLAGKVLPAGLFRERRDSGLCRADIVVLARRQPKTNSLSTDCEIVDILPKRAKVFSSFLEPEGVCSLEDGSKLAPCAAVAFCGIANPKGFFLTLESMGFSLKAAEHFNDHHYFKGAELDRLRETYRGLPLICTEKDCVKLTPTQSQRVHVLRAHLVVEPQNKLVEMLLASIERNSKR